MLLPAASINSFREYLIFYRGYSETGHLTHSVTPRLLQFSPFWSARFLCLELSSHIELCYSLLATRLILKNKIQQGKTDHITPLPVLQIQHKINTICYKYTMRTALPDLCDSLHLHTIPYSPLCFYSTLSLQISRTRLSTVGSRAFSVFGSSTWHDLPSPL